MREILFRGKRCDNGEWAQGCLVKFGKESFTDDDRYGIMDKTVLVAKTHKNRCGSLVFGYCDYVYHNIQITEIIPKTIGQFTGLTDKNGKKIFEGDIGRYKQTDGAKRNGKPIICTGFVIYNAKTASYAVESKDEVGCEYFDYFPIKDFEVIGNIHDNPELLENP